MKIYAYCRVSTENQSLQRQVSNIMKAYPEIKECDYKKEKFTGTTQDRPAWNELLRKVKPGDTIVFDSVSRMSRNAEEGMQEYEELLKRGVELRFLNEPSINSAVFTAAAERRISIATTTGKASTDNLLANIENAINEFMLDLAKEQVKIAFEQAQKERDDIAKRVKDGKKAKKEQRIANGEPELYDYNRGKKLETKKAKAAKEIIRKNSMDFDGTNSDHECIAIIKDKLGKFSRNSYYKYKAEIKAEIATAELEETIAE
jgi:DNA invertase Pin-like site-specific DNA recombinase